MIPKKRSQIGNTFLPKLAGRLQRDGSVRVDETELQRYRIFYMTYPGIWETLSPDLEVQKSTINSVQSISFVEISKSRVVASAAIPNITGWLGSTFSTCSENRVFKNRSLWLETDLMRDM